MTSRELMDKYGDNLFRDAENGKVMTLRLIVGILCQDILDTAKKRGVQGKLALDHVIREKNETWNAFSRLWNRKYPKSKLKLQKDALKTALEGAMEDTEKDH